MRVTFGDLIDRHQEEILRYLHRLAGRATDADDLFQETFLRAFGAFGRLRPDANHRAWLYRIATNAFLNHRRDRGRRGEIEMPGNLADGRPSAERMHELSADAARARTAIRRLPRRQRAAFVQRVLEEMSYRDIAAGLGCSEQTARAHVSQALRRLRRNLRRET